jgi:hypothetical protein
MAFSIVLLFPISTNGHVKERGTNVDQPSPIQWKGFYSVDMLEIHSTDLLSPYYKSNPLFSNPSSNWQAGQILLY